MHWLFFFPPYVPSPIVLCYSLAATTLSGLSVFSVDILHGPQWQRKINFPAWGLSLACFIILISYLLKWNCESYAEIEKYVIKWIVMIAGG